MCVCSLAVVTVRILLLLLFFVQEEELKREKQEQVVLLQELEEQKAKLEQMLLEARQEREHLKAAVTQKVPINQSEVPVHYQEVTSVTPGLVTEVGFCLRLKYILSCP